MYQPRVQRRNGGANYPYITKDIYSMPLVIRVRVMILCSCLFSVTLMIIAGLGGNGALFSHYLLRNPVERILFLRCLLPVAEEVHTADVTGTLKRGLSIDPANRLSLEEFHTCLNILENQSSCFLKRYDNVS